MLDTFSWLYRRNGLREDHLNGTLTIFSLRKCGPADLRTVYVEGVGVIMLDTFSWLYRRDGVREDNSHGTLIHITKKVRTSGLADRLRRAVLGSSCWTLSVGYIGGMV